VIEPAESVESCERAKGNKRKIGFILDCSLHRFGAFTVE